MTNLSFMPAYKVQVPDYLSVEALVASGLEEAVGMFVTFHAYSPSMLLSVMEMAETFGHPILVEPIPFDQCVDGEWLEAPISTRRTKVA